MTAPQTSVTDPMNNTTQLTYDMGDLATVTDPLGNSTTRIMDSVGRLRSVTNPLGYMTRYDYDGLNQMTKVTDPLGGLTQFSYDPNGNMLSVTDARNNPTIYTYDNMDRLATRKDPLLVSESYGYDGENNLTSFTDRKSQATGYTYDALNRRTQATYADASTTTYTYDAVNRLMQIVDSISGTITRSYDNLDRLVSETTSQGTVSYTYDAIGRRTTMTMAGQSMVNYTYDNANRLTQITQGSSTVSFTYNAAGRRTSVTLPNGVAENYTYDAASHLMSIEYWNGTILLGNLSYTYDAAGNRTRIGGSWARTGLPQALSSAMYDAANRLTNWGGTGLTYDANGNTINDGTNTYTWDARNRMASMTGASFVYDPLGRRVTKTIGGTSTSFLYDGRNPLQELSGMTPTANLLTGLGLDQFLTRIDSAGTRALLTDALGSTLALTDTAGIVQTEYTYEPFGNTIATGATNTNPFEYTGRENDQTGLYYYRGRYYPPTLQRFNSEDPLHSPLNSQLKCRSNYTPTTLWYVDISKDIAKVMALGTYGIKPTSTVNSQKIHLYAYTENNPMNFTDPLGLSRKDCHIATTFDLMCDFACVGVALGGLGLPGFEGCAIICTTIAVNIAISCISH